MKCCDDHIEYTNPAGKINRGENNKDAAQREFLEETGQHLPEIDLSEMKIYEDCDTIIVIAMLKDTDLVSKKINSDEIDSVKWINLEDIPHIKLRSIFSKLYNNYVHIWKDIASKTET
jgi:8-oxo-dGTP pyrophosphatase MutT (NUDIX family)